MSWLDHHERSEQLASGAEAAAKTFRHEEAQRLYELAAQAETEALREIEPQKLRTLGVTAVSAASLWFKAKRFEKSEQLAYLMLGTHELPEFARAQLRTIVQACWTESAKREAGVSFVPGQVNVSVRGGEVVTGGAPLELIVDKVQTIQSIFYRTVEEHRGLPLRKRGGPSREIQEACRPWLFQAPPGSYQFSIAIEQPKQSDFFKADVDPASLATRFLEIMRATSSPDNTELDALVPDEGYRATFRKLARNLAPTGKSFEQLEIQTGADTKPVSLEAETRKQLNAAIKIAAQPKRDHDGAIERTIKGVLRAVDLDRDFIEIVDEEKHYRISGLEDTQDDVIGPLVNRPVIVKALEINKQKLSFVDIELED